MQILFFFFVLIFSGVQNLQAQGVAQNSAQNLEDHEKQLQLYRSQQRWIKASEELKIILDKSSPEEVDRRSEEAAEAFFKARNYREAAKYYQPLSEKVENQNNSKILDKLVSAYARSSQFDLALKNLVLLQSLTDQPSPNLDYKKIFLLYDASRCKEVIPETDIFVKSYPKSPKTDDALWLKVVCEKNLGQISEALEDLQNFKKKYPESNARVLFWESRWNDLIHETKKANNAHKELLQMENNFYNLWDMRRKNLDANACLMTASPFSKKSPSAKQKKNKKLTADTQPRVLSFQEMEQVLKEQETEIQKLKPASFNEWVEALARIRKIPPALIYAILYEESHFNPKATSPAGALGLMQMIPETGFEIAEALDLSTFDFNDLLDPWLNSKFGITYLSMLMERFSGNLVYTIAAYNAGPEAVERWIGLRKSKNCEEWMDQIPYKETYNYVQKVLKSLWRFENEKPSLLPGFTQPSKT
ncbi:MAG: transglycosylase SLT domain-containing protein [Deltaproteobacteria bacterium]|nr:transglycosylase SLT domain-containing protein [Deltaproteobacteria bacterium]